MSHAPSAVNHPNEKGRPRRTALDLSRERSGRRCDFRIVVVPRAPGATTRLGRTIAIDNRNACGNGGRKHVERNGALDRLVDPLCPAGTRTLEARLFAVAIFPILAAGTLGTLAAVICLDTLRTLLAVVALRALLTLGAIVALGTVTAILTLGTVVPLRTVTAILALGALRPVVALAAGLAVFFLALIFAVVAVGGDVVLVLAFIVVVEIVAAWTLLFEARTILVQHAKIVVRELVVIFGLNAVALHLRVPGEGFVFFEQLRSVAAIAIVLPVALRGLVRRAGSASAATAATAVAVLTIVDQKKVLVLVVLNQPLRGPGPSRPHHLHDPFRQASASGSCHLTL